MASRSQRVLDSFDEVQVFPGPYFTFLKDPNLLSPRSFGYLLQRLELSSSRCKRAGEIAAALAAKSNF